jgi:hypothetical protein
MYLDSARCRRTETRWTGASGQVFRNCMICRCATQLKGQLGLCLNRTAQPPANRASQSCCEFTSGIASSGLFLRKKPNKKHAPVTSILAASGDISGWAQDIYSVTLRLAATDSPTLVSCPNASQLSQLPRCRKSQVRAVHLPDSCVLFLGHPGKCDRWQRVAFQQLASGSKNFGNSRPRLPTHRASDWKGGPCSVPAFGSRPNATDSSFSMACVSAASMLFANTSDAR